MGTAAFSPAAMGAVRVGQQLQCGVGVALTTHPVEKLPQELSSLERVRRLKVHRTMGMTYI